MKKKKNYLKNGFTLIELLVTLTILVIVVAIGYQLLSFGGNTFERGEMRYIAQENAQFASELITRELRYSNSVSILPEIPAVFDEYKRYIYISDDGILKHYTGNGVIIDALGGINNDAEFTKLDFSTKTSPGDVLSFTIETLSGTSTYSTTSDVQILNLPEGDSINITEIADTGLDAGPVICYSYADNEKRLTFFALRTEENPQLAQPSNNNVNPHFSFTCWVPKGTDKTKLVPYFEYIGKSISVNGVNQVSGSTVNDFSNPVVYTITAEDGTTVDYTVDVSEKIREPQVAGVKIQVENNDGGLIPYEDSTLKGIYNYISNECGPEGTSIYQWQWSDNEEFTNPITFDTTRDIVPSRKAGLWVRFGVKPVSQSGITADEFTYSNGKKIFPPIDDNPFWRSFINDIYTESDPDKPDDFVSTVFRRLDYTVASNMSPDTNNLNLKIFNYDKSKNYLVRDGGTHISKETAPYLEALGCDSNSYSATIDAVVDKKSSGYGVLINGNIDKNNNNRDSGYMFQFDPGAGGFLVRKIENGDHNAKNSYGLNNNVIYKPSDIKNNEFLWPGSDNNSNNKWYERYLTEIVLQIQNDNSLIFKATIIDEKGNRSNEMWFGDFGSYSLGSKTFYGKKMIADGYWSGGSMIGLRTWNMDDNAGQYETLFQEIKLGPGFEMNIETAEFISPTQIKVTFDKTLRNDVDKNYISIKGQSISNAEIITSNGQESLLITLTNPVSSSVLENGISKGLTIERGGVKQLMAGDVKISNGSDFDIEKNTTPPTSPYVKIRNSSTNLYIDGYGYTSDGSVCNQHSGSQSHNQQWIIEQSGSYVRIKNRATGLYLDGMGRTNNGADVGQWSDSNSNNQQWTMESVGSNIIKFKNRATGLYLDGMGRSSNGSALGQWNNSNSYNQQWIILEQ